MLVVIAGPSAAFTHRPENQVPQGSRNLQVILNFRKKTIYTKTETIYNYITIYHARKMKKLMFFAIIKFVLLQAV